MQKKYRCGFDAEDLNMLLGEIDNEKAIVIGYSLGGITAAHLFINGLNNANKISKLILGYTAFDSTRSLRFNIRIQKALG